MMATLLDQRNAAIAHATRVLPGSVPYDNVRPVNVSQRFDRQTLLDVVCGAHPHIGQTQWLEWFAAGHLLFRGKPVTPDQSVRGGQQYDHVFPETIEPDVDANIRVVFEDDVLVAVDKPAPLPMHPSGRFNKNTLSWILNQVYQSDRLLPAHRLDANTTGVVLLTRDRTSSAHLQTQFDECQVQKVYLARCIGHPVEDEFCVDKPIGRDRGVAGVRVTNESNGKPAKTNFTVLQRNEDGTSDLIAKPETGRTNQIRLHLWDHGFPICGDPAYQSNQQLGDSQTRRLADPPMCLHAKSIEIRHPGNGLSMKFQSDQTAATLGWNAVPGSLTGDSN